jgi:hypothetical protein
MGRLSEYVNQNRGGNNGGPVEVYGFEANMEAFGRIMTKDPDMAAIFRKYIRNVLREARKKLTQDAKTYMKSDPRKAARAVRYSVSKSLFGGDVNILAKKRGTAGAKYKLIRQRKIDQNPKMRGGNRRPRIDDDRNRLEYYYGADRGFILRFLGSGTVERKSRFGRRGSIRQTDWFGHTAPWHMEEAASQVAEAINEYVMKQANG